MSTRHPPVLPLSREEANGRLKTLGNSQPAQNYASFSVTTSRTMPWSTFVAAGDISFAILHIFAWFCHFPLNKNCRVCQFFCHVFHDFLFSFFVFLFILGQFFSVVLFSPTASSLWIAAPLIVPCTRYLVYRQQLSIDYYQVPWFT